MDTETAIKEITDIIDRELANRYYADLVPEYIEALEMAVAALRKQEPVKPNEFHTEPIYSEPRKSVKYWWNPPKVTE